MFRVPASLLFFSRLLVYLLVNRCLYICEGKGKLDPEKAKSAFPRPRSRQTLAILIFITILFNPPASFAVPPGTIIDNTAEVTFTLGTLEDIVVESNTVRVITVISRTPSAIDFLRYAPDYPGAEMVSVSTTYYSSDGTPNGQFVPISPPVAIDQSVPISLDISVPLIQSDHLAVGEPVFIRLTDHDQNIDTLSIETILARLSIGENGESELLRLTETNSNSGVFTGYIQTGIHYSPLPNDGLMAAEEGYWLNSDYIDAYDTADATSDSIRFFMFDKSIFIIKSAGKKTVAPGDYLQYKLNSTNVSTVLFEDINIIDHLPSMVRYMEGSATINGNHIPDPLISDDGSFLTFDAGNMQPGQSIDLKYNVEVGINARPGDIVNEAYAADDFGILSNIARATVRVEEEFFRNSCFIMGRVLSGDCDSVAPPDSITGIEGARVFLEDGTYAVTDYNGRYHFEGVEPGVHVLQLDYAALKGQYTLLSCDPNSRFAGSAHSRFIDLQGGATWQADFMLRRKPKQTGNILLHLGSSLRDSVVSFDLILRVDSVPIRNGWIIMILPDKLSYVTGSSRWAGVQIDDPEFSGNILTYRIAEISPDSRTILDFKTSLSPGEESDYLNTSCVMIYDTPEASNQKTAKIENEIYLRPETRHIELPPIIVHPRFESFSAYLDSTELRLLDKSVEVLGNARVTEIHVTGHSDNVPISPRSQLTYRDNYELSLARANSVANYLSGSLGVDRSHITVEGKGPDEPIANNSTREGRAQNRRVELSVFAEEILNNVIPEISSGADSTAVKTIGLRAGEIWEHTANDNARELSIDKYDQVWLETAEPGFEWLWPPADFNSPIPSLKVAVKHPVGYAPKLFLDGKEVSPLNFSEMLVNDSVDVAISFWSGIDIHVGSNRLTAVIYDDNGDELKRLEKAFHYSGPPEYVEYVDSLSNPIADNRVQSTIAVRLTDKDGYPVRPGVIGEWSVEPPYASQQQIERLQNNPLTDIKGKKSSYVVEKDGIALLKLEPASQTGEVVLKFYFTGYEEKIRVWLKPRPRDWVVVGLAEGTIGHNRTTGNVRSRDASGIEDGWHDDGRAAFFASGSVNDDWLVTIASDTRETGNGSRNDFMRTINPRSYFPLYGDAVRQGYAASSTQGVFVKVERDRYYALYGDFVTGLDNSELSRYNRTFTGLKSQLKTEKHNFNVFLSETNLAFVRDEIRGDGTSGLYYLSRNSVARNSEKIIIETRDRFRNEVILSTEPMRRYLDYDIDYSQGSIYFKRPIPSRDEDLNPVFIVVSYESNDRSDKRYNYGGRGGTKILDNKLELGGTFINEGRVGGRGNLGGFDATYKIGKSTEIKTELAYSRLKIGADRASGYAYLTEARHNIGSFSGRFYIRNLEPDFGLKQQNEAQSGTRKIGADLVRRIGEEFQVGAQFYRQRNLLSGAKRNFGETRLSYTEKRYNARAVVRIVEDRMSDGLVYQSNQLSAGVGYKFFNGKFEARLGREQSIGHNDNADYPTRTIIGADYNLNRYMAFYAQQEFACGEFGDAEDTRVGFRGRPWAGSQVNSSIQRNYNENGQRVFSNFGLTQTLQITGKLSVDLGIDHGRLIMGPDNYRVNPNEPPTSGSLDGFTAVSLGGSYRGKLWSSSAKIEYRNAESEDRYGISANIFGEPRPGLGTALSAGFYNSKAVSGSKMNNGDIQLSLAYRPMKPTWIVLNTLNFKFDQQAGGEFDSDNWRLVDNLSLNHRLGRKTRLSILYGAKYLRDYVDGFRFSDYIDMIGLESRYDLTPRWDAGIRLSLLHAWKLNQYDYGLGISTGFNIFKNTWLSVGYNLSGFEDGDFTGGSYSAEGPYLQFRLKFDYESAKSVVDIFRTSGGDIR